MPNSIFPFPPLLILLLFGLAPFFSCKPAVLDLSNQESLFGTNKVEWLKIDQEKKELLALSGSKLFGQYEILTSTIDSMNADRIHYSNSYLLYFVVGFWPEDVNSHGIEMLSFKSVNGCCMIGENGPNLDHYKAWNTRSFSLIQDVKTNSLLKNDSIYLSVDGLKYWTLPMEGRINSWSYPSDGQVEYVEKGRPVKLLGGGIRLKDKERKGQVRFQLGFISYDFGKSYDWNAFMESNAFKNFVMMGSFTPEDQLSIKDYVLEEDASE